MLNRWRIWYGKPVIRKWMEILFVLLIMAIAGMSIPLNVIADDIDPSINEMIYRIKPLQDKLKEISREEQETALSKYRDMDSHWSREEVGMLTCLGIISGSEGMFLPKNPVQIDQFLKMTVRAMGFTPGENTKYWAQNYIDIAIQYKLITKNEFKDYKMPISREAATRIIVKATLQKEEFPYKDPYNNPDNLVRSKILDYTKIKDENKQFVLQSYELGLIIGSYGKFNPVGSLTRAEAATIMIRYLNDASRVPFKPAEGEVYIEVLPDGTELIAYPPPKKEVIDAANAFKTAWQKSKGYVSTGFSDSGHVIFYNFFESEEIYKENSITTMQMGIDVHTINDIRLMEHPYDFTVYDAKAVKKLHLEVVYEMFKVWFEHDTDKAMSEFNKFLNYAITNDQKHYIEEITYNKRLMFFYRVGGTDGFSLSINSLP